MSWLLRRLQTGRKVGCHRVLTAGIGGRGGVLEGGEGLVLLQPLGKVLGRLGIELVVAEAVKEGQRSVSGP